MRPNALSAAAVHICVEPVDFRKSINGLSAIVEEDFELDSFEHSLFVNANKVITSKKSKGVNCALYMVNMLKKLYAVEAKSKTLSVDERYAMRQSDAVPIIAEIKSWLDKTAPKILPKSKLGEALSYVLKYCYRATLYVKNGA
jgi:DNA-binding transcriptional regulator WhiA